MNKNKLSKIISIATTKYSIKLHLYNYIKYNNYSFKSLFDPLKSKKVSADEKELNTIIKNLKISLINELDFEKETYKDINKNDLQRFLSDTNYVYEEEKDSTELKLKKITDNYYVEICFEAREPLPEEDKSSIEYRELAKKTELVSQQIIPNTEKGENSDDEEETDAFEFLIKIIKRNDTINVESVNKTKDKLNNNNNINNKENNIDESIAKNKKLLKDLNISNHGFIVKALWFNNNIKLVGIYCGDNIDSIESLDKVNNLDYNYHFVDFETISHIFQKEFLEYLDQEFNINNNLFNLIEVLAQDKDQRLYMKWLDKMNKFF